VSAGQRLALILAAVVVLVGGFVVAQGAGDDGDPAPAAQTVAPDPTETATGSGGATAPTDEPAATTGTETRAAPPPRVERVRIRGGQPVGEPRTLRFEAGDTIRLRFSSDDAAEVHIHGYDKYVNVPAGGSAATRFEADAQGIFEIEDHATGALLAELEVRP
jgi:hypothetical protein